MARRVKTMDGLNNPIGHPNDDYWKKKFNTQVVESGIHSGFRIRVLRVRISPWVPVFKS